MARSWTSTRRPETAGRREPVFSTKGEAATERAPPAHHGVEALVSSAAARAATLGAPHCAARVAIVYTNGPEQLREAVFGDLCTLLRHHRTPAQPPCRNSVHKWLRTASKDRFRQSVYTIVSPPGRPRNPRVATVYTNAPERLREAVFGDLCTLLHPHRPPARASRRRSRHNSVHKCPRTASRGRFRRSVYTIASPPAARATPVSQQCTQMAQNSSERPFSAICVHYCVPTGRSRNPRVATVYTNGPEQLREAVFGDLCTLLCPPASPRPPARASRRNSVHNHEAPNIPAPGRRTSPRSG